MKNFFVSRLLLAKKNPCSSIFQSRQRCLKPVPKQSLQIFSQTLSFQSYSWIFLMRFLIFLCKFNSSFIQELTVEHNKQMTWLDLDYDTHDTCFLSWEYAFLSRFLVCILFLFVFYPSTQHTLYISLSTLFMLQLSLVPSL